jgi:transmembrane sensor
VAQLSAAEMAQRLAWQPRLIELANTTLADAVAEFNRRTQGEGRVHLEIGDAELAGLRIGGSIYPDQTGDFVRLLERSFDIKAERDGDTITLRRAR